MTSQDYVNQALSAGLSQGTIDSFIANNPGDYGRIWSAFNLGSSSYGYTSPTTSYASIPTPTVSAGDPNPAATIYAASVAAAAAASAGPLPAASDELMIVQGTLGGGFPSMAMAAAPAVAALGPAFGPSPVTAGFDVNALIKIALLVVAASWIGSALFSGRGK